MYKYGFFHSKEFVEVHKMVYSTDIHYTIYIHMYEYYVRVLCFDVPRIQLFLLQHFFSSEP